LARPVGVPEGCSFTAAHRVASGNPKRTMVSAVLAAAALAELTGGVLFDDESDEAHASSAAITWARGVEADASPDVDG
jgi:hypothetical protein